MTHQQEKIPATRADLFAELEKVNQILEAVQGKLSVVASIIRGADPQATYDRLSTLEDKWMTKQQELHAAIDSLPPEEKQPCPE